MRDVDGLRGLHVLRTMHNVKKRSIPMTRSSTYLNLYMLNKEKERLLKEIEKLCLRDKVIKKRLKEIDLEVNKLQEAEAVKDSANSGPSGRAFIQKDGVKKEWKKMLLNY